MKKWFLLSIAMVATLVLNLTGLMISAEEWEIPVIEEVAEEEIEEISEEEVELFEVTDVTEAEAEVALYDGENLEAYYASFEDAVTAVISGTFTDIPTIKLLKDVELGTSDESMSWTFNTGKEFIVDGENPEGENFKVTDKSKDRNSSGDGALGSITLDGENTKLVAKNVTFTRDNRKTYALFTVTGKACLELSDNSKIGGTSEKMMWGEYGSAVTLASITSSMPFIMSADTAVIEYCTFNSSGNGIDRGVVSGYSYSGVIPTIKLEKGTIKDCTTGITLRQRFDVNIGDGFAIRNCTTAGIQVGGTGNVLGAVFDIRGNIYDCKKGILAKNSSGFEIKGTGTISGCSGGVYLDKGKLTLKGKVEISGNYNDSGVENNITLEDNDKNEIIVDESFTGKVGISFVNDTDRISNIKSGTGFEALETIESITKDNADCKTFAYYDAETGKFGWTKAPVLNGETDSGVYTDGTGLIRFMTTFTAAPSEAAVESFGTYALFSSDFTDGMNTSSLTTFKRFVPGTDEAKAPEKDGQSFIVDVVNIPAENKNTTLNAISFVKLKGIEAPVYYYYTAPVCVGENAKNLGAKNA